MLRSIGEFINEITGGGRPPETFEETDFRLAAAALLVHVATSDNDFDEHERAKLRDVLAHRFELGMEDVDRLIDAAVAADREAVDLYQFTTVLNRAFDDEGRRRVVEMMFEIAYADGELSEFEDNLVWRAADLMHVPSRDRVTIRKQIRDERAGEEN
ncbi:MAG: TerB family tellurite resistance protein [Bradyrhizobiaceae bacterium]|nr:TerB family tellurite resistance protein [Bradyrhizobiaceae bacterium]